MRRLTQLILLSATAVLLAACGADQAMKKGDKFYALGEYYDAATQYKKAYSQTPARERDLRGQRALKMAECYRRLNYTQKAIAAYNNAIRYKQTDSLTHLFLAQQLMKDGNYKVAARNFQTALDVLTEYEANGGVRKMTPEDSAAQGGTGKQKVLSVKARAKAKEKEAKARAKAKAKEAKEKAKARQLKLSKRGNKKMTARALARAEAKTAKEGEKAAKQAEKTARKEAKARTKAEERAAKEEDKLRKSADRAEKKEEQRLRQEEKRLAREEKRRAREAALTQKKIEMAKKKEAKLRQEAEKMVAKIAREEARGLEGTRAKRRIEKMKDKKANLLSKADDMRERAKSLAEAAKPKDKAKTEQRRKTAIAGQRDLKQWMQLARTGLRAAEQATARKKEGSTYTVKRENFFNSRRADYSPMLTGEDYDQLFFTSTRNQAKGDELSGITGTKNADIFYSQKDDKGKWQRPEVIDTELNSDGDEGACAFTPDGRTMYLTQCLTDPDYPRYATIVSSNRSDAAWSKGAEVKLTRDTLSAYAHPAISPDGQWLYFTSNMPGGMGGYDIWRIRLTDNGLGGVENLGAPINTAGDEMFPTFRPNGDLYFSSDGHEGLGGLDIFIAHPMTNIEMKTEEERKAEEDARPASRFYYSGYQLEHPGYPLNSQGDDFGMTFEGLKNQGYFSSNRGDGKGWDHIYSFYKPEVIQTVKGWVYEAEGYELTNALVYMVGNDGTNLRLSVKGDGSFTQVIKPGVDYLFLGSCKGYLNHQEHLRVDSVKKSEEYVLQFPLASITAPVMIDNIFYDFDKATLRPESAVALDKLVELLKENPNVTIELSAHCDYKGPAEYNKRLSQRRAETVVKYLTEHGIESDRLTPVGYGKEKPKTIRKKLTERYPFLKENDVLTEEFIKTLTDEQQEQCNQMNRRTEFIVLRTTYGLADSYKKQAEQNSGQHERVDGE